MFDHIPSLSEQGISHIDIANGQLSGDGPKFNGSLVVWKGRRYLVYRRWDMERRYPGSNTHIMNLAVSELGEDWLPNGQHWVVPTKNHDGTEFERHEDPRFFIHKDRLWISCAELYTKNNWRNYLCCQRVFRLTDDWQVDHSLNIHYGNNFKSTEKNWTYFSWEGKLYCYYDLHREEVMEINDETGDVMKVWRGGEEISVDQPQLFNKLAFHWPWGLMRGGASPIPTEEGFMCFIHSSTPAQWKDRRYTMSALVFEAAPPFRVKKISRDALVYGTRKEPFCNSGNIQCIFPAGAVLADGIWQVSAGINDEHNTLMQFEDGWLKKTMIDADHFRQPHYRCFISTHPQPILFMEREKHEYKISTGKNGKVEYLLRTDDPVALQTLTRNPIFKEVSEEYYETHVPKPHPNPVRSLSQEETKSLYTLKTHPGVHVVRGHPSTILPPEMPRGIAYK